MITYNQLSVLNGSTQISLENEINQAIQELFTEPVTVNINQDLGLVLYRNPLTRNKVIEYYKTLVKREDVAIPILKYADINDIPLSLAFSIAWIESMYNPQAWHFNRYSIDRGLFQLNSGSFPNLTVEDFYNPEINASNGLKYLRYCINQGKNEVAALAIYNAGIHQVTKSGTPKRTLNYINSILNYKKILEYNFEVEFSISKQIVPSGKTIKRYIYKLDKGAFID